MTFTPNTDLTAADHSAGAAPLGEGSVPAGWWPGWVNRWGLWRARGLRGGLAALGGQERELADLAATVERKFVAIGGALQTQSGLSGEMVTQGARLLASFAASATAGKPAADEAADLVREMLAFTEENNRRTSGLLDCLEGYNEQIGRLLEEEQRVERIVAPLRIIQTLFRIESAVLPGDLQTGFVALSGEIPKFEEKVRVAFAQHTEALSRTRAQIDATAARLREDARQQAAAAATMRSRAGETLVALEKDFAACRERDARLEGILREIDRQSGRMIVSLQYQDITRQKMEHVLAVTGGIAARASTVDVSYLHHACRLEALQARAIRADLDRALRGLADGLSGVDAQVLRIEQECWPRAEFSKAAAAAGARVAMLRTSLQGAAALMPRAAAGVADAIALLHSLGDVAATVAATASDMAEDMRMIALNAQVQAAQAGDAGAGLLILAERTFLISEEIKAVTRSIGVEFAEAARQLAAAVAQGALLQQAEQRQSTQIAAATTHVEGRLARYREETAGALETLGGLLGKFEDAGRIVAAELQADPDLGAPLDRLHDLLAGIAASVAPFAGREAAPELSSVFSTAARRYTMASERTVHAAALGGGATGAEADAVPAGAGATAEAEADANIELFS